MNTETSALIVETIRLMTLSAPTKKQLQRMHQITAMITGQISAFETLMQMLVSSQPNATQKKAIITIMENLIRRQNKLGDFSKKMDKWKLHENLYAGLLHPAIEDSNKTSLQKMYIRVLFYDKNQEIKTDIVSKVVSFFQKLPQLQRQNSYLVKSMRHIVRALLHENLNKQIIHRLLSAAFSIILNQTINNSIMITEALKAKNQQAFSEKIQILAYSIQVLKFIYIKTDPQRFPVLKLQLLKNQNISKLIFLCLEMRLPDQQPCLVIKTRGIQVFKLINLSKKYAFEILVNGLMIADKTKKWWNKQAYHNIYVISQNIISVLPPLIVRQLQNYPQENLEDPDLIKQTLKFIYYAIRAQCFYSISEKYRDMIIFQMCINCLVTTNQLRQKSAEDFIGFKEDVANTQQQNSLQNKAAKIIEAYTDQIDGSITRITKACFNIIQFQLTANPKYSQQLPQCLLNSPFFTKFALQDQISTCFMVLAVLSYQSKHRLDFVAEILDLFIRRKEYLMNIDLSHEVRICYYICYSYYIDNFYQMCFSDRSKQQFHIQMIEHMITVIEKLGNDNLQNNDLKQGSVLQAIDCLGNCLTQPGFIGALFLEEQAQKLLAAFFLRILNQLYGIYNIKIASLILDFFKGKVRAHFREGGRFQISPIIRQILAPETAIKINEILISVNTNKSMIREMLINILSIVLLVVNNPVFIYPNICELFKNMHNFAEHKQKILDCVKVITSSLVVQYKDNAYLINRKSKRQNQNNTLSSDNNEIVQEINADYQRVNPKEMLIVVNQLSQIIYDTFADTVKQLGGYGIIFGILQDFIQLDYQLQLLLIKLKDFTMKCEDEAIQQYSLYLMIQIAQSRYISINKQIWQKVMIELISFMQNQYIRREKAIYGKILIILLCCLQADFHHWLKVFKAENLQNIWKLLIANQKNYRTVTQQKIFVIKMISFVNKYELEEKDLLNAIRICSILTYFLHNGQTTNWAEDLSQKQLSDDDEQRQYWQAQMPILSKNHFLSSLDNEVNFLRDICLKFLQVKGVLFKQFVQEMPIAIRNFIKNNVINYKDDASGKAPLRKIYKVKTIKKPEDNIDK